MVKITNDGLSVNGVDFTDKQDKLIAGENITISGNTISTKGSETYSEISEEETEDTDDYISIKENNGTEVTKVSSNGIYANEFYYKNNDDYISITGVETSTMLPKITSKPLFRIEYNCGLINIFKSIGIIGDSLASGEMQGYTSGGTITYADMYEYSWGQQIAKMAGVDVYNFSSGGQYAKGWMNGTTSRTWYGAQTNLKNAYFIGLAHNDYTRVNDGTYTGGIGDVSTDINDNDYTQNADTYVGWYARIIQAILSVRPRAFIFLITTKNKTTYAAYNTKIREIANHFLGKRVYLIDLEMYSAGTVNELLKMGNHLSSAGYLISAYEICNYITWLIRMNPSQFKYASLVDSDIYETNPLDN